MVFIILNNAHITPHRLHAFARLVARLPGLPQRALFTLLVPETAATDGTRTNFSQLVNAAEQCAIVTVDTADDRNITLHPQAEIESIGAFRRHMQHRMFDMTDKTEQDTLFGLFSAYYAAKNMDALQDEVEERFDRDLFPGTGPRRMNSTKLNAWLQWAAFLGLGWQRRQGSRQLLAPDSTVRLRDALPRILSASGPVPLAMFVAAVGDVCPELDGGAWFRQCRGSGGDRMFSLMLSTALRALNRERAIHLIRVGDSSETWQCYPGDNDAPTYTHIELSEAR